MPIGATIGAVGAIGGALISSSAASKAAKQQAAGQRAAMNESVAANEAGWSDIKAELNPYLDIGKSALPQLMEFTNGGPNTDAMLSALEKYPGYQFAIGQAKNAINADAAIKGSRVSGNQTQGAVDYAIGAAGSLFDKYLGQLTNNAQIGQTASGMYGNFRANTANNIANAKSQGQIGMANAKAAGTAAQGQIWSGMVGDLAGIAGNVAGGNPQSWLNKPISSIWSSSAGSNVVKEAGAIGPRYG